MSAEDKEGFESLLLERLLLERPRLEHAHRVRRALYVWLLPAVSLTGALANALWLLLFWRCRLVRRERSASQVGNHPVQRQQHISLESRPIRKESTSFRSAPNRSKSSHSHMDVERCQSQHVHMISSEQLAIRSALGSPSHTDDPELSRRPPIEEKSACALHLELHAIACVALLLLSSVESLCVSQFQMHPSLMHSALCRLWPLIYHLVLTFPPVILIFPLFHKCMRFHGSEITCSSTMMIYLENCLLLP